MPNQKDIAKALGTTQATVSRALRGDRTISEAMRRRVNKTASKIGYHHNTYLTVLMSNMRKRKSLNELGVIGLLIEAPTQTEWYKNQAYRIFHQGVLQRGWELGFKIENFFLMNSRTGSDRINNILTARGINGIILAPPYHGNRTINLQWEYYAAIGVGFGWEKQELNRVVYDQLHNYVLAFNTLRDRGYRRIGTVLGETFVHGNRHGSKWFSGYADCQCTIPENERIPIFEKESPPASEITPENIEKTNRFRFRKWYSQWEPDALLTMVGHEKQWLDMLKLRVPQDIGLACIGYAAIPDCAHIDANGRIVGSTALEQVTAQIIRNEFGPPEIPKTTMIEGRWVDGPTVCNQG